VNLSKFDNKSGARQAGSALVYILIAIALLAALTTSFMRPASQQTTAQSSFKAITNLKSQIEFMRSSIQECVLNYPAGDSGLSGTTNEPYPVNPSSTYLTSPHTPAGDNPMGRIRCPGNPGASADHASIFGGKSGKFMPPAPDLFEDWQYHNGIDGVFFFTQTDKTDAFLQTAMEKLDDEFAECEADIIDASAAAVELTTTADATLDPKCPLGSTCFRVWLIALDPVPANTAYNGDVVGDEASCP